MFCNEKWTGRANPVHFDPQTNGHIETAQPIEFAGNVCSPLWANLRVHHHCPYVKSIRDRIIRDVRELQQHGINSIAIMSNDPADYAEDSFDNMKLIAQQYDYPFPYVWDETQQIAKDYGAVCTPDFFGFNANMELQYRGRLDASRKEAAPDAQRELFNAMLQVAKTGQGPHEQLASMGCSIKWKDEA
jgi:hypothetical protein